MRSRDVSSAKQKVFLNLGQEASVGDGIAVFLLEIVLNARLVKTRARDVVNVEVEVRILNNVVLKLSCLVYILFRNSIFSFKMSGLADSDKRSGAYYKAFFKSASNYTYR